LTGGCGVRWCVPPWHIYWGTVLCLGSACHSTHATTNIASRSCTSQLLKTDTYAYQARVDQIMYPRTEKLEIKFRGRIQILRSSSQDRIHRYILT
jgi:hypothetical protein